MTHGKPCVTRHAKANACVHMHANGHAYKWDVFVEGGGEQEMKREREEMREKEERKEREKRRKRKEKEKKERDEGGRLFLPQFISILTVGTRWAKE